MSIFSLKTTFVLACFPPNNLAGSLYPTCSLKDFLKFGALCCFRTISLLDWHYCSQQYQKTHQQHLAQASFKFFYLSFFYFFYFYCTKVCWWLYELHVCSQSNFCTWDAWALKRVGKRHTNLSHAVTFQQRVTSNLLPAQQCGKRESSRARNHQSGGRKATPEKVLPL